jgi:hypothetical protein
MTVRRRSKTGGAKRPGGAKPPGGAKRPGGAKPPGRAKPPGPPLFVDAIEGGVARLLLGTRAFALPAALLPAGVKEGGWVTVRVAPTSAPPDDTEAIRAALAKDDPGGDIEL